MRHGQNPDDTVAAEAVPHGRDRPGASVDNWYSAATIRSSNMASINLRASLQAALYNEWAMQMTGPAPNDLAASVRDDESVGFGRYRIFPRLRLLLRDGVKTEIGARAFDILWMLIQANGELVTKEHLLDTVWDGAIVEENNLQAQVSAIRRALSADRDMVRTEFGRGYRLVAERHTPSRIELVTTAPNVRTSALPVPLTQLLGRERELDEVDRLFLRSRLVTITGAGGIGKSRLALEFARRAAARHPDGINWVEMAKVSCEELVASTIAAAVQLAAIDLDRPDALALQLADKRLLLVIDNCEHLAEPVGAVVEAILHHAPNLQIIITSQEPLSVEGEQIYRLAPLSVPPAGTRHVGAAMAHSAFELFVDRASASGRHLVLDEETVELVAGACRRLDGLPLALELAAARVASLGVRGVLAALDDRFRLLTAGRRTALPRHRTLRATVDWSFHLLDEREKRLFRRLSIFAASFDADAVRAVAAPEDNDPWTSIDLLSSLVGKSLLLLDLGCGTPRYRFLESIRFYASEKLAESGEVAAMGLRHATYFADVIRQACADWKVLATDDWRADYADMADDLTASLDWAFSEEGDKRLGIDILVNAAPFWTFLSLHDECRRRTAKVLEDRVAFASLQPVDEMKLHATLGTALGWATGPVEETRTSWIRTLELAGPLKEAEFELQAQYGLWLYNLRCGQYCKALDHANEMIVLAKSLADDEALAVGYRIAGVAHHFLGDHSEGRQLLEISLSWHEINQPQQVFRFGLDQRIAGLAFLSRLLWVQGYTVQAKETAARAVAEARLIDHANTLCCALAEGWCTVHAFDRDHESVAVELKTLRQTASSHGLGFWKSYGDLFDLWVQIRSGSEISPVLVEGIAATVEKLDFDPGYSTLLSDALLAASTKESTTPALSRLGTRFMALDEDQRSWASPEFRRVAALLQSDERLQPRLLLEAATSSTHASAAAWTLRISLDLAKLLRRVGTAEEAVAVLENALHTIPEENNGAEALEAHSLAAELRAARRSEQTP